MKLNLLPTTVSRGRQAQGAVFLSVLIAAAGIAIGIFLNVSSSKALDAAKSDQQASIQPAQDAYNESQKADQIMSAPPAVGLIRDANLAQSMIAHNTVYPDLYDGIKPYIPAFFRINSISASSAGDSANVILVGTIDTYQQYADLMLAFSRIPGLSAISRSGYVDRSEIVPNISEVDEHGYPRRLDQAPIPDAKLDRLAYFEANVQQPGYSGEANFGSGTDATRGAMPTSSLVTVTLTVPKNLQVPDPTATLQAGTAPAAPAPGGGGMGGPPGLPPGAGGPPGPTAGGGPGAGSMKGGRSAADQAD